MARPRSTPAPREPGLGLLRGELARVNICLDPEAQAIGRALGAGNLSRGIRTALQHAVSQNLVPGLTGQSGGEASTSSTKTREKIVYARVGVDRPSAAEISDASTAVILKPEVNDGSVS